MNFGRERFRRRARSSPDPMKLYWLVSLARRLLRTFAWQLRNWTPNLTQVHPGPDGSASGQSPNQRDTGDTGAKSRRKSRRESLSFGTLFLKPNPSWEARVIMRRTGIGAQMRTINRLGLFVLKLSVIVILLGCNASGSAAPSTGPGQPKEAPHQCAAGEAPKLTNDGCCQAGELPLEDGGCLPAGEQTNGCPAGKVAVDGGPRNGGNCRPAGIPPEMCGDGFESDGNTGCSAILPKDPCPNGMMAIPGEKKCHEVAPCPDGKWGGIPSSVNTQFVDGSYGSENGPSDGSAERPWSKIQLGIDAAESGAVVAVAAGSYEEDLEIASKAVHLWGRCPQMAEVVGSDAGRAAIFIQNGATGTELNGIGIRGGTLGILLSGSEWIQLDHVWIHDTGDRGVDIEDAYGPTSMKIRRSLVEFAHGFGVAILGSYVTLDATVVRSTEAQTSDQLLGAGLVAIDDPDYGTRSSIIVTSSVIEKNHACGVCVSGSDAIFVATVVRDTQPQSSDQQFGQGVGMWNGSSVAISASVIERNHHLGLQAVGSDLEVTTTVVRETAAQASDDRWGRGIDIERGSSIDQDATATIRNSVIDMNHDVGVCVLGAKVEIESSVVRATQPIQSDKKSGRGIDIDIHEETGEPSAVTIRSSLIDSNHDIAVIAGESDLLVDGTLVRATQPRASDQGGGRGIVLTRQATGEVTSSVVDGNREVALILFGSSATISASIVRGTLPKQFDQLFGRGISIQPLKDTPSSATITSSVVENNHEFGVAVVDSNAIIRGTSMRKVTPQASDGSSGDGVSVTANSMPAIAQIEDSRIIESARAGIVAFGATVVVSRTRLDCNYVVLDGEALNSSTFTFQDAGANTCGCGDVTKACQIESLGLKPPTLPDPE